MISEVRSTFSSLDYSLFHWGKERAQVGSPQHFFVVRCGKDPGSRDVPKSPKEYITIYHLGICLYVLTTQIFTDLPPRPTIACIILPQKQNRLTEAGACQVEPSLCNSKIQGFYHWSTELAVLLLLESQTSLSFENFKEGPPPGTWTFRHTGIPEPTSLSQCSRFSPYTSRATHLQGHIPFIDNSGCLENIMHLRTPDICTEVLYQVK